MKQTESELERKVARLQRELEKCRKENAELHELAAKYREETAEIRDRFNKIMASLQPSPGRMQ